MIQEHSHNVEIASLHRGMQGRATVAIAFVDVRTAPDEASDSLGVANKCRQIHIQ